MIATARRVTTGRRTESGVQADFAVCLAFPMPELVDLLRIDIQSGSYPIHFLILFFGEPAAVALSHCQD
jgi:hypothetical protein